MLAGTVEAAVEEADSLLQVVSVVYKHPVSHHLLLPDQTLQLVAFETQQPFWTHNQLPRMDLKVTKNPNVVVNPIHGLLWSPSVYLLRHSFFDGIFWYSISTAHTCGYMPGRLQGGMAEGHSNVQQSP